MLPILQYAARLFRFYKNNKFIIKSFVFCSLLIYIVFRYQESQFPFNKELTKEQLKKNSPPVDIKGTYFINMDRSVERKESFIKRFTETKGPLPLIRFPGVLVTDKSIPKPGDYGCTLAHANCLKAVAKQESGWYLICEDDGFGDFGAIASTPAVKEIVAQTDKKFINLSSQIYNGVVFASGHSLSKVHARTTAYLVHSDYANELADLVLETAHTIIVDLKYAAELREPRLLFRGNGKGAFVGLIDPPKNIPSEREKLN